VFAKDSSWGEERGGHVHQDWMLDSEVDLGKPNRVLPFKAAEALAAVTEEGTFLFQVRASSLLQTQHALLNDYRLNCHLK
jgi:hypothetical protein